MSKYFLAESKLHLQTNGEEKILQNYFLNVWCFLFSTNFIPQGETRISEASVYYSIHFVLQPGFICSSTENFKEDPTTGTFPAAPNALQHFAFLENSLFLTNFTNCCDDFYKGILRTGSRSENR